MPDKMVVVTRARNPLLVLLEDAHAAIKWPDQMSPREKEFLLSDLEAEIGRLNRKPTLG
jgi:hypothetical protein